MEGVAAADQTSSEVKAKLREKGDFVELEGISLVRKDPAGTTTGTALFCFHYIKLSLLPSHKCPRLGSMLSSIMNRNCDKTQDILK